MTEFEFPFFALNEWQPTARTLHHYAKALGAIRRALTPRRKHWYHISLRLNATGVTTTTIPCDSELFEIALDLTAHRVAVTTSRGARSEFSMHGQPLSKFWHELNRALGDAGIHADVAAPDEPDAAPVYDPSAVERYWRVISQLDILLKRFRYELRGETSAVQLWPHHFDLAMLWFSGRLVPGKDPSDEEQSDEEMNFGFCIADPELPEPYLYVTAYPAPEGFIGSPLPPGAYWHTVIWNGAILPYRVVSAAKDPEDLVLSFWRDTYRTGSRMME